MSVKVGCCGFPVSQAEYYRTFRVVEVQKTFYDPPRISTLARWRADAPEEFEFMIKAWQLITHEPKSPTYRKLRREIASSKEKQYGSFRPTDEVLEAWDRTREAALALRARVIIFQCPPSFEPVEENIRNMERFFSRINRDGFLFAWEPRGRWKEDEVLPLCRELNLIHVVDPYYGKRLFGRIAYFRLHGMGGYRYRYTVEDLERLRALTETGSETYVMFNNSFMYENAWEFLEILRVG